MDFPGYRRHLLARFAAWTVEDRAPARPSPTDGPVDREEWLLFGLYRAILGEIRAEDAEGFANWASLALARKAPDVLARPGHVVAIEPIAPAKSEWRLLEHLHKRARSMVVTLPFDPEPALAEVYAGVGPTRQRFLDSGFVEEPEPTDGLSYRAPGLDFVERELFRSDVFARPRLSRTEGLQIIGGPRGEGVALLVAREAGRALEAGMPPEDVLIVVPRIDEDAERVREALASWGLPVADSPTRRLSGSPTISALRLAMRLPVDRWEVSLLTRLLRNGQVRWEGGPLAANFGPAEAASAIRSTRVYRDRENLRKALESALDRKPKDCGIIAAIEALDRLARVLDPLARPGAWASQVDRLRRIASALGLDPSGLDPLWDALEDRGWVLHQLGPAIESETLPWATFAGTVESLVVEVEIPAASPRGGAIRIEPFDAMGGARARVVIAAGLAERTSPTPEAVELDGVEGPANPAYSRQMLRFAGLAGSAEERLVLAYPTTDLDGSTLLPAGFLDDLIRRLDDPARARCVELHARFDPTLLGHDDLARSPVDERVLAIARASGDDPDFEPLRRLARSPIHAPALRATADAFAVASKRRDDREFGPYDGRLRDPGAIVRIAADFGPDHAFSPSQLESFALCPFQFYQRYVLGLKLVDGRQELDEDYAGRGSQVHDVLEKIHQQVAAEGAANLIERLGILIETDMRVELEKHDGTEADVAEVLREIGTRRTNKTLGRYLGQFRSYASREGEAAEPHKFEVLFGQPDNSSSHPHLKIGEGGDEVLLQGKIDRIDLIRKDGRIHFRVIDYKTGSNPASKDIHSGLASQLPLYALAVERLVLADGDPGLIDVGYWSLPKDGFKSVKIDDWAAYRDRLKAFVLGVVRQLRSGEFPIDSPKKECRKTCDFGAACRVVEVRIAGKSRDDRPTMEAAR